MLLLLLFAFVRGQLGASPSTAYSMVVVGTDPGNDLRTTFGFGLGGHVPFGKVVFLDIDLLLRTGETDFTSLDSLDLSLRPQIGFRFGEHFGLFVGPALHSSFALDGQNVPQNSFIGPFVVAPGVGLWPGYQLGLNIAF